MPSKVWVVGEEVLAADFNNYIQEQVVSTFANSAARASALSSPNEGQLTYLADVNQLHYWDGAAWTSIMPAPQFRHDGQVLTNNSGGVFVKTYLGIDYPALGSLPYAYTMIVDVNAWISTTAAHNWDVRDEGGTSIRIGVITSWDPGVGGAVSVNMRGKKNYAAGVTCGYSIWWLTNATSFFGANTVVTLVPQ